MALFLTIIYHTVAIGKHFIGNNFHATLAIVFRCLFGIVTEYKPIACTRKDAAAAWAGERRP
jgi:hypothetical protein